jgi:hypothetical protein
MSFGALFAMSFVVLSVKGNWIEEVLGCRPDWCSRRWMTTYEGGVTVLLKAVLRRDSDPAFRERHDCNFERLFGQ